MYVASDGFSYTLGFPIEMRDHKRVAYQIPFFGRRVLIKHDGMTVGHRHEGVIEVSWVEAKALLESMRSFINRNNSRQLERFEQMLFVANHDGSLPPGITPDFS